MTQIINTLGSAKDSKKTAIKRKLFINKKIQLSYLFNILLFQIISCFSILFIGSWLLFFKIDNCVKVYQEPAIMKIMLIILVIVNVGAFFWSVFFLRSIAGPVKKIQLVLRDISEGKLPEKHVAFRTNDFFQELLPDLNAALDKIKQMAEINNL